MRLHTPLHPQHELYMADPLNLFELGASLLIFLSCILQIFLNRVLDLDVCSGAACQTTDGTQHVVRLLKGHDGEDGGDGAADDFMGAEWRRMLVRTSLGLGIVLLWTSQWWRAMLRSQELGPLVLMFEMMIVDVARFLLLMIGPMLGFAGAMSLLFEGIDDDKLGEDCLAFSRDNELGGFWNTLVRLFELMLGYDIPFGVSPRDSSPFGRVRLRLFSRLPLTPCLRAVPARVADARHGARLHDGIPCRVGAPRAQHAHRDDGHHL